MQISEPITTEEMDEYYLDKLSKTLASNYFAKSYQISVSITREFNQYLDLHNVNKTIIASRQMILIRLAFEKWKSMSTFTRDAKMDICVDSFHNCYDISVTI